MGGILGMPSLVRSHIDCVTPLAPYPELSGRNPRNPSQGLVLIGRPFLFPLDETLLNSVVTLEELGTGSTSRLSVHCLALLFCLPTPRLPSWVGSHVLSPVRLSLLI